MLMNVMVIDMVSDYRAATMLRLPLLAVLHFCYLRLSRRQEVVAKYRSRIARVEWPYIHCEQTDAVQTLL